MGGGKLNYDLGLIVMYCPSCGTEYRDGFSECVDCHVPLVQELPRGFKRRRIPAFPKIPKTSNRPFLLVLLGFSLTVTGGLVMLTALMSIFFKTFGWDGEPGFGGAIRASEILVEGVAGLAALSVAYAIWKERAWGRPALVVFVLLTAVFQGWLESANVASLAGSVLSFAFVSWYLYLWPNATDYYRRLRESGDSSGKPPNPSAADA